MLYFAYGSNLNVAQMEVRCPKASFVDKLYINDWRLIFNGVASIEKHKGSILPGGIWDITPECEAALDRYEGFPSLYRKIEFVLQEDRTTTEIMTYIMNHRCISPPSYSYYKSICEGYDNFGLDTDLLERAAEHAGYDNLKAHQNAIQEYNRLYGKGAYDDIAFIR